jgi:hypothetical protein
MTSEQTYSSEEIDAVGGLRARKRCRDGLRADLCIGRNRCSVGLRADIGRNRGCEYK